MRRRRQRRKIGALQDAVHLSIPNYRPGVSVKLREPFRPKHIHRWKLVPDPYGIHYLIKRKCEDCDLLQTAVMDDTVAGAHSKELWPWLDLPWA